MIKFITSRKRFIITLAAALTLITACRVNSQTVLFSDNFNRPDSTNLDVSTTGMGGQAITTGDLTIGLPNVSPWLVQSDANYTDVGDSNAMIAVDQVRMGGFGHTVNIIPNLDFSTLVSTGEVIISVGLTNHAPQGSYTIPTGADRYVGIGVGFSLANANSYAGGDRWMQYSNDFFVSETTLGYIDCYDNTTAARGSYGGDYTYSTSIGGGSWVTGVLAVDMVFTNTAPGSTVTYNVLFNGSPVVTGRSFTFSATSLGQLCMGIEERSQYPMTNYYFSIVQQSSGTPPTSLTWRAGLNNTWNIGVSNWVSTLGGSTAFAFSNGMTAVFNDTASNTTVNVPGTVNPASVTLNNVNSNYVFSGTGTIGGTGTFTESGSGFVTMNLSNSYSGNTTISSSLYLIGNNSAFGSGQVLLNGALLAPSGTAPSTITNALTISGFSELGYPGNTGLLTLSNTVNMAGAGQALYVYSPVVMADGVNNGDIATLNGGSTLTVEGTVNYTGTEDVESGTLIYNGANVTSSDRLVADAGAGNGIARLVVTNGAVITQTGITGNLRSGRTASTGTNYIDLAGLYSLPNASPGNTGGAITLEGDAAYSQITFWPGGDCSVFWVTNNNGVGNTVFNFNGGILRARENNPYFFQGITSCFIQSGGANFDNGGFSITVNQPLLSGGGNGGLNMIGSGTLTLGATETYTGTTTTSNGILNVTGSLAGGGAVNVLSSGTLSGSGTIAGPVTVQSGGAIGAGAATGTPATLTLQNNLTIAGNVSVQVNKSLSPSNDLIAVSGTLTNTSSATLTLVNSGLYNAGDSFKLFSKPLSNGTAIVISPVTPGHNQVWTNRLAIDGTIGVVGTTGNTAANLSSLALSAGTLSPAFNSNVVAYTTSVEYTNSSVTVTPVAVNTGATIQVICNGTTNTVASGAASPAIPLNVRTNVIDVRVTAPGGSAINDYVITMMRVPPNVILILADDQGFSDWSCYGSEIPTPNLDSLAATGLRFRHFYNASRCSPTRDAINTGLYTQQVAVTPTASLPPLRTDNNVTIADVLGAYGYHTYMAGKWHIGNNTDQLPENRGYEEVFTYINGTADHEDEWTEAGNYRFATDTGETTNINYNSTNFYQPDAIGDYALQFMGNQFTRHPGQPFYMYLPFGSAHFWIQAPTNWADTNLATYSQGWDVVRYQRYTNMLAKGVIDSRYALSPNEGAPNDGTIGAPGVPIAAWNTLSAARQADLVQRMSTYAAMIEKMDYNIGRVVQFLQQNGQYNNTIIFALSDNGGNYEGGPVGSVNGTDSSAPLTGSQLINMGGLGQPDLQLGGGWAHVSNTPFRLFKHFDHFGGQATPFIVHWPEGVSRTNQWENQSGHIIDVMATILDVTATPYPTHWTNAIDGTNYSVLPLAGQSLKPLFNSTTNSVSRNLGFEHEGNRAYISGGWKFVTKNFSLYDGSSFANELELYNITNDPSEMTNLAYSNIPQLKLMVTNWNTWCTFVGDPNSLLVTTPTNPLLPVYPTFGPAPMTNDLFVDTYQRPEPGFTLTNISANASGMWGNYLSVIPPLGVNEAYYQGYEVNPLTSIQTASNSLWMAYGGGTAESGIIYNFDGSDITGAGGFSVELNVQDINDNGTDPNNKYAGFGVGLTQAQAAAGGDISSTTSFRGEAGNPGVSSCFIDLNYADNVEVWTNGVLARSVPVGANNGTITASFACNGFSAANQVTLTVFYDGMPLSINPGGPNTNNLTFTWNSSNNNYIGLSARASSYVQMDNLAIRLLPLANDLATEYAEDYGLTGANAAPGADPDMDGVNNFGEWAFGGDPVVPDSYIAGFRNATVTAGNHFQFQYQRYENYAAAGLQFNFYYSTDLVHWTAFTPIVVADDPNEDKDGYDVVTLQVPSNLTAGQNRMILRITASPQ